MSSSSPQILLLTEGSSDGLLEQIYGNFLTPLRTRFRTQEIDYTRSKSLSLAHPGPAVILAMEGAITAKSHKPLHTELVSFVQNGGTLICCCNFSSFCRPLDLNAFMAAFGLPWKSGDYHRTDFVLNLAFKDRFGTERFRKLEPAYSMKALHVKNVQSAAMVYGPTTASRTQSFVFPPSEVDLAQSPAVLEKCGDGAIAYVGDVNNEEETRALLMVMIGMWSWARVEARSGKADAAFFRECFGYFDGRCCRLIRP